MLLRRAFPVRYFNTIPYAICAISYALRHRDIRGKSAAPSSYDYLKWGGIFQNFVVAWNVWRWGQFTSCQKAIVAAFLIDCARIDMADGNEANSVFVVKHYIPIGTYIMLGWHWQATAIMTAGNARAHSEVKFIISYQNSTPCNSTLWGFVGELDVFLSIILTIGAQTGVCWSIKIIPTL